MASQRETHTTVARQPIFDRRMGVASYELLFPTASRPGVDFVDAGATSIVALNALIESGLDRIVGSHYAWIDASRELLLERQATNLPRSLVGLEIDTDLAIDDALTAAIAELSAKGYGLALGDFRYTPETEPLLDSVDIVKLDFQQLGRTGIAQQAARLAPYAVMLLAENVEAHDDHRYCLDVGCELIQGPFYRNPDPLCARRIAVNRIPLLKLIAALHDPKLELRELEPMISRDVTLSLRLLRYINSAFFGLRHEVRSVGQAMTLLGIGKLKAWAALAAFADIHDKPSELTVTALLRARFCELAVTPGTPAYCSQLFTVGLFSVVDALLDAPMEHILASLPFPEDMRRALIGHEGRMGRLLECVTALEAGAFQRADELVPDSGQLYLDALEWTNTVSRELLNGDEARAA